MGGEHWRATLAPGAVEIPELRSRDAKHFQNQDGTRTAVIVPGMHWQDDDGTWQDVDLNLNYAPDAPDLLGRANDVHVRVNNFKVHVYDRRTGVGIRWSIPQRPAGAGRSAAFRQDGLDWRYVRTRTGVKLEGTAAARLGARTFVRHYVISTGFGLTDIDVNALLLEDGSGGVYGPGFACPAPIGRGSDGLTYSLGAFAVDGRRVVWAYDDTHVPGEAFPLTIDPTTSFSVPGSGDDGYVNRKSGVYPPGGTITTSTTAADLTVSRSFALSTYEIWVSVMRFDTSSLALAASISTAKLHLYGKSRTATDGRSLVLEWYDPSNWPISTAMYAETAPASPAGSVGLTVFLSTVDNAITLANADVNINQLGYTAVRAHISGGQPTGNNKVTIASWDDTTNAAPALEITYTPRGGRGGAPRASA